MISVVINADTRDGFDAPSSESEGLFHGTRALDYLVCGIENKRKFLHELEHEIIVFVDEHNPIPIDTLAHLRALADKLVLSKHSKYYRGSNPFSGFNDINYLHALSLCRGEYVMHFDQDVAAFSVDSSVVSGHLQILDNGAYKFISLPSACTPDPVVDPSYEGKWWASTRFFLTKRPTALEHAIREPQWAYATYGQTPRRNPWMEHMLTLTAGHSVLYPPIDLSKWAVFPWAKYKAGTLSTLHGMTHDQVAEALRRAGGLPYDGVDCHLLGLP